MKNFISNFKQVPLSVNVKNYLPTENRNKFTNTYFFVLTLQEPTPQSGQTHSNNLSTVADELF